MEKYLQQIEKADGKKVPAKVAGRLTASELLIIEPEYIVWHATEQLYPFVFQALGDWRVTVAVSPPQGFTADANSLSTWVESELESLQFTITEVGSQLVPTQTQFRVIHRGRPEVIYSNIGIMLTPGYAQARGFDVEKLGAQGLIKDPPGQANMPD